MNICERWYLQFVDVFLHLSDTWCETISFVMMCELFVYIVGIEIFSVQFTILQKKKKKKKKSYYLIEFDLIRKQIKHIKLNFKIYIQFYSHYHKQSMWWKVIFSK